MTVSLSPRGIGAAALAAGLLLAGCSSSSDVPPTEVSTPEGGTKTNTDTGSGGQFPDVNTTPTQRPTSTIQELNQAPTGLSAAPGGTQYGEALVGGPTSTAEPPAPPPPPEPPQEALAPIPEPGVQTDTSEATPSAPSSASETAETPDVAEPQPTEPAAEPEPVAEPAPAYEEPQGEGQTIQGTANQAPPPAPEPAPVVSAPEPSEPVAAAPQAEPSYPAAQPAPAAPQQAQLPADYGSNQAALAPEAYGVSTPGSNTAPSYGSTQVAAGPAMPAPAQPYYGGEPVGLIYFREGSSDLSDDDRGVLEQIAQIQRAYGGVVNVVGHASVGGASAVNYAEHQAANQRISEARANAVAQQLMKFGVPLGAIRASAAGDSQPLYSEVAPTGVAGNRRVEVYLSAY
jgi:outer membrane protein OmpA-like peptidoglycan-associated protein